MLVEIIKGAIGSGKSRYILDSIENNLRKSDRKNIIVVPEQFSYKTERIIVERFGGAGLNNVEVITLSRLVSRFLEKKNMEYLTPSGKMMIIYKILKDLPEDNLFYGSSKKPGFAPEIEKIITEFTQYMITPEILRRKALEVKNNLLKEKLNAIADIIERYIEFVSGRFYDSEEDLLSLAEFAEESGCFSDCDFWFDDYSVILPEHYRIMEAFLNTGSDIHVVVSVDSQNRELYDINRGIEKGLKRLSEKVGAEFSEYRTDDVCRSIKSEEMLYLLENIDRWSMPDFKPWEEKTKDISLFVSKDLYQEIRHVAISIRKLIMNEGYRYRDISVVCGNVEGYAHIFEAVFNDFKIPYFSDMRLCSAEHPVSMLVLSIFNIIMENWSYPSVFRYLRTGYVYTKDEEGFVQPLDSEGIDLLENYVLKYGIRGKSIWLLDEKWETAQRGIFEGVLEESQTEFSLEEREKVNLTRKTLIKPFIKLYDTISGRRTVREFSEALFNFLIDINLFEGLNKKAEECDMEGLRNEAEQFRKIWNVIIETINQLVVVMGEEKCTREDFSGFLQAGLSAVNISIIPSGLDRVSVSSIERSRQHEAKVMFITGAVFGSIPKQTVTEGILTDNDRILFGGELSKEGMFIDADNQTKNDMDRFNFFTTLFGVSDRVYITYPATDIEGNTERPASIISEFYNVFPNMTTDDDIVKEDENDFLYSKRTAYQYMLSNYKKGGLSRDIYNWYKENEPQKLEVIEKASLYKKNDAGITPENARKLYDDKKRYSISRLNEYGKCPFGYFVKYGLKAKEQQIWQIQKFDLGSIMHLAIELYCKRIDNDAKTFEELKENWQNLSKEKSNEIAKEVMEDIKKRIITGMTRDEKKICYIMMRIEKIVLRAVEGVRKSLCAGEYVAVCYEKKFRVEISWGREKVLVNGVIDRVDMAEIAEEKLAELRVVDYKTGKKNFSVVSICNRQDIQLIMYAIAAVEMYKNKEIRYSKEDYEPQMRAVVYNRMRDDITLVKDESEAEIQKIMEERPDGLIMLDKEAEGKLIYDLSSVERMDKGILENGESEVIRVALKKDGNPTEKSQVTTSDAFSMLMDYVKKSVIEIDKEIFSGIIKIYPTTDGQNKSCKWCEFEEICLYNDLFDESRPLVEDEDEAWEIIKKEVKPDEQKGMD